MKATVLASGSKGNCTYLEGENTALIIDAGLSARETLTRLECAGGNPELIEGILVTHEHSDHIKGVGILSRKYHLPVYANPATWAAMEKQIGAVAPSLRREFDSNESFFIGDFSVYPFSIPHDAADPVGYRVFAGGRSAASATDMGYFSPQVLDVLAGTDILVLESNHDADMLRANEHYSQSLKTRILGRRGHLSNEACADALWQLYRTGVRHAVLGHLSGENNTPELALRTVCDCLRGHGLVIGEDIFVDMAWRDHVGGVYEIG